MDQSILSNSIDNTNYINNNSILSSQNNINPYLTLTSVYI